MDEGAIHGAQISAAESGRSGAGSPAGLASSFSIFAALRVRISRRAAASRSISTDEQRTRNPAEPPQAPLGTENSSCDRCWGGKAVEHPIDLATIVVIVRRGFSLSPFPLHGRQYR